MRAKLFGSLQIQWLSRFRKKCEIFKNKKFILIFPIDKPEFKFRYRCKQQQK